MKYSLVFIVICAITACKKDVTDAREADDTGIPENNNTSTLPVVFDLPADSAPHFVNVSYIDLNKITRISKFRSGIGHDYPKSIHTLCKACGTISF